MSPCERDGQNASASRVLVGGRRPTRERERERKSNGLTSEKLHREREREVSHASCEREKRGEREDPLEPVREPLSVHHPLGEQQRVEVPRLVDQDLPRLHLPLVSTRDANDGPDRVVRLCSPCPGGGAGIVFKKSLVKPSQQKRRRRRRD